MPKLRIVGDGERDKATLPALVRGLLGAEFEHIAECWQEYPRLNRPQRKVRDFVLKGYGQKLYYVLQAARAGGEDAVVAGVDADREPQRECLGQMREARDADRSVHPPLPAAIGEAKPHNEAWLLDDPVAVRTGLRLEKDVPVPTVSTCPSPKRALQDLHAASARAIEPPLVVWAEIAAKVDLQRCNHRHTSGFGAFAEELRAELGPLFMLG